MKKQKGRMKVIRRDILFFQSFCVSLNYFIDEQKNREMKMKKSNKIDEKNRNHLCTPKRHKHTRTSVNTAKAARQVNRFKFFFFFFVLFRMINI